MHAAAARIGATALALGLTLSATPAFAQASPNDFRLPSASPTTTPRAQGPVDADAPVIVAPRPSPRPTPSTTPSAAPTAAVPAASPLPSAPATARPLPVRQPQLQAPVNRARPAATGAAPGEVPAAQSSTTPAPNAAAIPTATAPIFSTTAAPPAPVAAAPASPTARGMPQWLFFALGLALGLLAAAAGFLLWRRRRAEAPVVVEFERPIVPALAPTAAAPASPPTPAVPAAAPPPAAPSQLAAPSLARFEQDGLEIALEARRMSASLMATTLSYRLTLTNRSDRPLAALAIEGDMIAAHGQLPPERQVANRAQKLELRHAVPALAPGESAEFTGDIRVPLSQLTPIRSGDLALFVPLARFRVEAGALILAQTFVIGESSDDPAAGLRPFRLDLGPRTYSRLGQRAIG